MKAIVAVVRSYGYKIYRTNVGKFKNASGAWVDTGLPKGHPDLYGHDHEGRIFYIEVKYKDGKPSPEQVKFLEEARADGCRAGIARSVAEAMEIIQGVDLL